MISSEESGREQHESHEDTVLFVGCLGSCAGLRPTLLCRKGWELSSTLPLPAQRWLNRQKKVRATQSKSWGGGQCLQISVALQVYCDFRFGLSEPYSQNDKIKNKNKKKKGRGLRVT